MRDDRFFLACSCQSVLLTQAFTSHMLADKVTIEAKSPAAGTIKAIHVEVGQTVEVGKPFFTLGVGEGEPAAAAAPPKADAAPAAAAAPPPPPPPPKPAAPRRPPPPPPAASAAARARETRVAMTRPASASPNA